MSGWQTWSPGTGGYLGGPTPPQTPTAPASSSPEAGEESELEALRRENALLRAESIRTKAESAMLGSDSGTDAAQVLQRAMRCSAAQTAATRRQSAARSITELGRTRADRRMLLRAIRATVRIEAVGRRAIAVRRLTNMRAACACIQSTARGWIARRAYALRCQDHRSLIAEISRLRADTAQLVRRLRADAAQLVREKQENATLVAGLAGCLIPGTTVRVKDEASLAVSEPAAASPIAMDPEP